MGHQPRLRTGLVTGQARVSCGNLTGLLTNVVSWAIHVPWRLRTSEKNRQCLNCVVEEAVCG